MVQGRRSGLFGRRSTDETTREADDSDGKLVSETPERRYDGVAQRAATPDPRNDAQVSVAHAYTTLSQPDRMKGL